MKRLFISALILGLYFSAFAAEPAKPSPGDKCPVCGMFVAKYPDFLTRIVFKDGSYAVFDGAKDMFKYLLNLPKYNPAKKSVDIDSVFATDYYSLRMIDGRKAFYAALVISSWTILTSNLRMD